MYTTLPPPPRTTLLQAKVQFVYKKDGSCNQALLQHFEPETLPARYGGSAELIPIEQRVVAHREALEAREIIKLDPVMPAAHMPMDDTVRHLVAQPA